MAASINRWVYPIEALANQALPGRGALRPASPQDQALYSITVAALVRTLTLTVGGVAPSTRSALWKDEWHRRLRLHSSNHYVEDDPDAAAVEDPDGHHSEPVNQKSRRLVGLGFRKSITAHGVIFFPSSLLN